MALKLAASVAIAACAAQVSLPDGGSLKVYNGSRPATPDTAVTTQTVLVDFTLPADAFGNPVDGSLGATATANAITPVQAAANGTATWFRMFDSSGNPLWDGDVSDTSGSGDAKISSTNVVAGIDVSVVSLTFLQPKA